MSRSEWQYLLGKHPLVQHAIEKAWCNPARDSQFIIKPARFTTPYGSKGDAIHLWDRVSLPQAGKQFHLFQIGQVSPALLNMLPRRREWMRCNDMMAQQNLLIDIYNEKGLHYPRFRTWFLITEYQDILIAIEESLEIGDLGKEDIFIRFYTNDYFRGHLARFGQDNHEAIRSNGIVVETMQQYTQLAREIHNVAIRKETNFRQPLWAYADEQSGSTKYDDPRLITPEPLRWWMSPGSLNLNQSVPNERNGTYLVYHNGRFVVGLTHALVKPGDVIEYVYDSSIATTINFTLPALKTFLSERDRIQKYLLTYAGDQAIALDQDRTVEHVAGRMRPTIVDFHDDMDLYLAYHPVGTRHAYGVYIHRNNPKTVSQVTHRDYGLSVQAVQGHLLNGLTGNTQIPRHGIRAFIRITHWDKPLFTNSRRLHDLDRLPFQKRVNAMVGIDSLKGIWDAASLENSAVVRLMETPLSELKQKLVQDAYGFYGMAGVMHRHLSRADDRIDGMPMRWNLHYERKVLTPENYITHIHPYVAKGKIGAGRLTGPTVAVNIATEQPFLFEVNNIVGNTDYNEFHGYRQWDIDPKLSWRFYQCDIRNGQPDYSTWRDVTGDSSQYSIVNDHVVWHSNPATTHVACRNNLVTSSHYGRYDKLGATGEFSMPVRVQQVASDGAPVVSRTMASVLPFGHYRVMLNGIELTLGLDFVLREGKIIILNREWVDKGYLGNDQNRNTSPQFFYRIEAYGHCTKDLEPFPYTDVGFTRYGKLSYDLEFDLSEKRLAKLAYDGAVALPSEYARHTQEYGEGQKNSLDSPAYRLTNGRPYHYQDYVPNLEDLVEKDSFSYYLEDLETDRRVKTYLTQHIPKPIPTQEDLIPELFSLYSPFMNEVYHAVRTNVITQSDLDNATNDDFVYHRLESYRKWLDFDPCIHMAQDSLWNPRYVIVHPIRSTHYQYVSALVYNFLERANRVYLNGALDFTKQFKIV